MRRFTADWRQRLIAKGRGKRRALKLIKIEGVNSELVAKLATLGISDVNQLLEVGSGKETRAQLASELGVPSMVILELVKMADLTRIVDIKGTRVRLLIDAGIDSVGKLVQYDPERLRSTISAFNLEKRIMKRNPTLVETTYWITQAKKLPKIVEE